MIIRKETQSDIQAIFDVTKLAFENHPFSQNTEQYIINALRATDALTISLVAELEKKIVGYIAFSPVTFTDDIENWYGLGPISVVSDHQRKGIGTKLMNEGLAMLKDLNADGCILVGDPSFYERFGFENPQGLQHEGVPQENLLVLSFCDKTPTGFVNFHRAFAATQ